MIEWVFIDVGNVLFDDDPQNFHGYRMMHEVISARHPDYTFDAMLAEREKLALAGMDFILTAIARQFLTEKEARAIFLSLREFLLENYDKNHRFNPDLVDVLARLQSNFRLGIIANQSPECRRSLERRGLADFFDVIAISDELELHKPDVRLYQWAIDKAGCDPPRAVMIGDRRDNDIAPAHSLSMRTILLRWPRCSDKGWCPEDPRARAFLASCDRVPLFSAVPVGPEPDRTVASLREIPVAVSSLAAEPNPTAT